MKKLITCRFGSICVISLLLSACANIPDTPPIPAAQLLQQRGYVTVSLVTNAPAVSIFTKTFDTIDLKGADGKLFSLKPIMPNHNGTLLLGGWLQPGKYAIQNFKAESVQERVFFDASRMFADFEVTAGEINQFQTLVYQPVGDGLATIVPLQADTTQIDQWIKSKIFNADSSGAPIKISNKLLQPHFPVNSQKTNRIGNQGLIVDLLMSATESASRLQRQERWAKANTANELANLAKSATTTLNNGIYFEDGSVAFGSKLGQILERNNKGQWTNLDIGNSNEVMSVFKEDNLIVAGMDNGTLRISNNKGISWQESIVDSEMGHVIYITKSPNNVYFVAVKSGTTIKLLKLLNLNSPSIPNKEINLTTNSFWVQQPAHFKGLVSKSGNKLIITTSSDTLETFDLTNEKWATIKTPNSYQKLKLSNNGNTLLLADMMGFTRHSSVSRDAAKTWSPIDIPRMATDVHLSNDQFGAALVLHMGTFSSSTSIDITNDGGATWSDGTPLKEPCLEFSIIDKTHEIFCTTGSGQIIFTKDGKQWLVERTAY